MSSDAAVWFAVALLTLASANAWARPARLFEPVPPWRQLSVDATTAYVDDLDVLSGARIQERFPEESGERVLFRQRVRMDADTLKSGEPIEVTLEGRNYLLHFIDSYERPDGVTYFYSTDSVGPDGGGGPLSTFTTFRDGRPFWSSLAIGGKHYQISPEGGHYVVTRSLHPPIRENLRLPVAREPPETGSRLQALSFEREFTPMASDAEWSIAANRRRACCTWWYRIPFVVIVNVGAKNPYGITEKAKVEARVAFYFDVMNAALRNSGESNFVYYREITYLEFPDSVPDNGYWKWATTDPGVEAVRARNKAAASLLLLGRFVQFEASLLSPGELFKPSFRVAIGGGYLRDDSRVDAQVTAHEIGHVLGKDHEYEWSRAVMTGIPDPFPLRIGWSSCATRQHCIMGYGDCGVGMETVEIFTGYRAAKLGYPVNPEVENSVLVSNQVGRELARDWP